MDSNLSNNSSNLNFNCNMTNFNITHNICRNNDGQDFNRINKQENCEDLLNLKIKYELKRMKKDYILGNKNYGKNYASNNFFCEYFLSDLNKYMSIDDEQNKNNNINLYHNNIINNSGIFFNKFTSFNELYESKECNNK